MTNRSRFIFSLTLGLMLLATTGCLRSRVVITSEPSDAEIVWRGEPYGATPVEIPFIWHWYYDYEISKPGYEKIEMIERFRTPPWALFPLDFILEVVPIPITDTRRRHYVLKPIEDVVGPLDEPDALTTEPDTPAMAQ